MSLIGPATVGKKAAKFGYRKYGVPGAVVAGGVVLVGYVVVKRALERNVDEGEVESAVDVDEIRTIVRDEGVGGLTDVARLREAVDEEQLREAIDVDELVDTVVQELEGVAEGGQVDLDDFDSGSSEGSTSIDIDEESSDDDAAASS